MSIRHLGLTAPLLLLLAAPAFAAPEDKALTEPVLREFYQASIEVHLKPFVEYEAFWNEHTREDVQFALTMVNHFPGQPDQKQTLIMDKKKSQESLKENYAMSQGATIQQNIADLYIGTDGKTANVTNVTTISKIVDMPRDGQIFKIELQSQSTCKDILTANVDGIPQLHQSTCYAENYFYPQK